MAATDFYDEDDLYDGDEYEDEQDGELSLDDKKAMEKGTADVKKALGANSNKVTVKQIQEALWHYYYDVEKSVTYLSKTFVAPPPPKPTPKKAPESKLHEFSFSSSLGLFVRSTGAVNILPWSDSPQIPQEPPPPSCMAFTCRLDSTVPQPDFHDMPWLNTPISRQATLIAPPSGPRGGLLGGAEEPPKMSKLQALAAARKKKNDQKNDQAKASQAEIGMKRLSITDESRKETSSGDSSPAKRLRGLDLQASSRTTLDRGDSSIDLSQSALFEATAAEGIASQHEPMDPGRYSSIQREEDGDAEPALAPTPSAFAKTLCDSAPDGRQPNRPDFYAMPHAASSIFLATAFSEPSPDDIVLAAQAKAGRKIKSPAKATSTIGKKDKKTVAASLGADAGNGISNLKISEVPPPKNKGLDVAKEYEKSNVKKSISFVVVGHVDAGKSTLMGRLLLELKYVQERTVEKYRRQAEKTGKQSFALAWVMDQRTEERERGVTIDIATNHFETSDTKFTILDAPGHRDFVPNMIAGASQADFAILVIDANTGAYEKGLKGQTREHVLLLRSLGVQRLVVAVNKLDMVGWSRDRFDEISQQVMGFLTGLGFPNKLVSFIPISGLNGDNIASRSEDASATWYQGPTLIECLEDSEPSSARAITEPFRMSISEVFRSQQQGTTTLAGRIDAGNAQIGDAVIVQPSGEAAYIKSMMVDTESQEWAVSGQSITIALTDIDPIHIRVGDIVCSTVEPISIGDTFTMKAMAFEHLMPMPVDLHRGRLHVAGQIQSIPASLDKATGEVIKKKPKVVQPGGVARVSIKLGSKVPLERGQRVVLRSGGETIAAGLLE
ncbi:Hsp70 suppressor, GTPase facilitates ribosomal subunit dissociation [Metarhizium rileyi]|uniref:Elongation factor 1 alpha-like protein n=1 Tax=Metarhizium rileyi (strain RCEF 4871) TaxID=1649241 RepID=A0A5C6GB72_METRR|nr:Hsp70 suppressor, GTPase facilitates ribosomal subunit dissociation [Metarhizium rileyi]